MYGRSWLYWSEKKYPETIQALQTYAKLINSENFREFSDVLDSGYRSGGWPAALRKGIGVFEAPYWIGRMYGDLGDKDNTFKRLDIAFHEHRIWLMALRTQPEFDSLRSDPRWAELIRRIGLPQ